MDLMTGASPVALMLPGALPINTPAPSDATERHNATYNGVSHAKVTERAHAKLVALLNDRGNNLAEDHETALYALVGSMTEMAQHKLTGRWAIGLPTGTGKTTAITA